MINVITDYGFSPSENENEYVKGDWTIRIEDDNVEVFNIPHVGTGRYYFGPINKVDIKQLLEEINDFDRS